ncbi:ParA family protein [Exiguobacterium indicum]|uniref:ParA family protein n=1 Tax=Exiguobacterium indicum TaxID=296995 RepID=UPI0039780AD3
MNANVISIINMKGGVGKTTLTCNIAFELARKGKKVLVIDVDPQFNTTQTFFKFYEGNVDSYNDLRSTDQTITNIFSPQNRGITHSPGQSNTKKNVIYKFNDKGTGEETIRGLSLVPGDLRLIVDVNVAASDRFNTFFIQNKLKEEYDYIIIDCPPTWGQLTSVALSNSDYYLIPTKLDEFSTIGITILADLLAEKVASTGNRLQCLGVVYMMLNPTKSETGIAIKQKQFKKQIEKYFEIMKDAVHSPVKEFDAIIYNKQPIATSSVIYMEYKKKYPELSDRITDLVGEIEDRINGGGSIGE